MASIERKKAVTDQVRDPTFKRGNSLERVILKVQKQGADGCSIFPAKGRLRRWGHVAALGP